MKHRTWLEPLRTIKNFPDPKKMKAQWMPEIALFRQPNGKCRQFTSKPGPLISLMVSRE
jgi:hypothetical protein